MIGEGDKGNEDGWETVGVEEEVHVFVFEVFGDVSRVINSQKKNTEGEVRKWNETMQVWLSEGAGEELKRELTH